MKSEIMSMNDLAEVSGGLYTNWGAGEEHCWHNGKVATGKRKIETDTALFFLTVYSVKLEYYCPDCGHTIWEEES